MEYQKFVSLLEEAGVLERNEHFPNHLGEQILLEPIAEAGTSFDRFRGTSMYVRTFPLKSGKLEEVIRLINPDLPFTLYLEILEESSEYGRGVYRSREQDESNITRSTSITSLYEALKKRELLLTLEDKIKENHKKRQF